MTRLEQLTHRLDYLLSQYEDRKNDPTYKLQVAMLATERRRLLGQERPAEVD